MEIATVIVTATSTLLGVALTLYFTNKREESKFIQDIRFKKHLDMKSFYIDMLSSIERVKRYTEQGRDYGELLNENSIISSKANIIAPETINEKLGIASQAMYVWSSYYRQSLPSKIGDTGMGIYSSDQQQYRDKADKYYPNVAKAIADLIIAIKVELRNEETNLGK